jgi:hypothetical protein
MSSNSLKRQSPALVTRDLRRAQLAPDGGECGIDGRTVGYIGREAYRRGTFFAQLLGDPIRSVGMEIDDCDPTTSLGEMVTRRFTNARPAARHDGHPGQLRVRSRHERSSSCGHRLSRKGPRAVEHPADHAPHRLHPVVGDALPLGRIRAGWLGALHLGDRKCALDAGEGEVVAQLLP